MRAPLKTLLRALPLSTLVTALLVFWQGIPKGKARIVILAAIGVAIAAQTLKTWITHPQGRPLVLLRYGLLRDASRLPTEKVVKKSGDNPYVYIEQTNIRDVVILWCFDGAVLGAMDKQRSLRQVAVPAHGFRLNLGDNEVDHYVGFVMLEANQTSRGGERTYAIVSPQLEENEWRPVEAGVGANITKIKRALAWANQAIGGSTKPRGRGDHFRK